MPAIVKAIKVKPRIANGGTTAPNRSNPGAGGGGVGYPGPGIYKGRQVGGIGGNLRTTFPTKESPNTEYAKGSAPASSTPASPYTPAPWDSQYELSAAAARNKYANTLTGIGVQKTATEQDYGLSPQYNDYQSNPYSRAALLEQSYQRANRGTTNSMAASGQLYAGASQNALSGNRDLNDQERNSLEKSYRGKLQELSEREAEAKATEVGEIGDAGWKRVEAASNAPLDSSTTKGASKPAGTPQKSKPAAKLTPKQEKELGEAWRKLGQKGKK